MRYFIVAIVIFLSGCSVSVPPIMEYRLAPKVSIEKLQNSSCKEESLKVSQVFSASSLMSHKMRYIEDDYQELSYNESKWATAPSSAINAELVKSIREAEIFSNVESYKSRSRSDYVLETNIEEFVQYYKNENRKSFSRVSIVFSLIDVKSAKIIESKRISKEIQVKSLNAKGGVKALNEALADTLVQNSKWLSEVCK